MEEPSVRIVEQEGASAYIIADTDEGRVEVMTEMEGDDERLPS
jgi:hypothetical protein